jgi:hypothetical protein
MGIVDLTSNPIRASIHSYSEWRRFSMDAVVLTFEQDDPTQEANESNPQYEANFFHLLKTSQLSLRAIKQRGDNKSKTVAWEYELLINPVQRFEHYYHGFAGIINTKKLIRVDLNFGAYGQPNDLTDTISLTNNVHWDIENYEILPDDDHLYTEITIKGLAPANHFTFISQPFSNRRT